MIDLEVALAVAGAVAAIPGWLAAGYPGAKVLARRSYEIGVAYPSMYDKGEAQTHQRALRSARTSMLIGLACGPLSGVYRLVDRGIDSAIPEIREAEQQKTIDELQAQIAKQHVALGLTAAGKVQDRKHLPERWSSLQATSVQL